MAEAPSATPISTNLDFPVARFLSAVYLAMGMLSQDWPKAHQSKNWMAKQRVYWPLRGHVLFNQYGLRRQELPLASQFAAPEQL